MRRMAGVRTKIITCETLRKEIELVLGEAQPDMDVIWLESGLHDVPKKLHVLLQNTLDGMTDCDRVIIAMGRCGGSLNGLKTGEFETVLPRVDDCISLLFGSDKKRNQYGAEHAAVYLTYGWASGERSMLREYEFLSGEYDEETAAELLETIYGNFRTMALLDTGAYSVTSLMEESREAARLLGLTQRVVPVELTYMRRLLTGPWNTEEFCIVKPRGEISF